MFSIKYCQQNTDADAGGTICKIMIYKTPECNLIIDLITTMPYSAQNDMT